MSATAMHYANLTLAVRMPETDGSMPFSAQLGAAGISPSRPHLNNECIFVIDWSDKWMQDVLSAGAL